MMESFRIIVAADTLCDVVLLDPIFARSHLFRPLRGLLRRKQSANNPNIG